jgi:ankyrin repeat protein
MSSSLFWVVPWATADLSATFLRETRLPFVVRGLANGQFGAVRFKDAALHVTPLPDAALKGDLDALCSWLQVDSAPVRAAESTFRNFFRMFQRDALLIAIAARDAAAVSHIVRGGVDGVDLNVGAPLCRAVSTHVHAIVDELLGAPGIDLAQRNEFGYSAMFVAAASADIGLLQLLKARGAAFADEVEFVDSLTASARRNAADCVKWLCEWAATAGFSVNARGSEGDLPLLAATRNNHADAIAHLLRAGAQLDLPCRVSRLTPLAIASRLRGGAALQALLTFGRPSQAALDELLAFAIDRSRDDVARIAIAAGAAAGALSLAGNESQRDLNIALTMIAAAWPAAVFRQFVAQHTPMHSDIALAICVLVDNVDGKTLAGVTDARLRRIETSFAEAQEQYAAVHRELHLPVLRKRFVEVAIGLQPLEMPVDQVILIFDMLTQPYCDSLALITKWNLAVAVKHRLVGASKKH